jgi:hypothetical protein
MSQRSELQAERAAKQSNEAAKQAAERCEFQLTYARSAVRREFSEGVLTGSPIDNAYGGDLKASGEWDDGDDFLVMRSTPEEWITRFARYAINEAVHEALEWFRVDGKPWLDPHGDFEDEIYAEVGSLCDRLAKIRSEAMSDER